jgi:hypothetical protein
MTFGIAAINLSAVWRVTLGMLPVGTRCSVAGTGDDNDSTVLSIVTRVIFCMRGASDLAVAYRWLPGMVSISARRSIAGMGDAVHRQALGRVTRAVSSARSLALGSA